jgi:hypothetical protein
MAYSTDLADLLAALLAKFVTLNRHQLAGQAANLDFWLDEAAHCLAVLDGYNARFERLRSAQMKHVAEHHTIEFDLRDPCCTQERAAAPTRIPDAQLKQARRSLREAAYRFLVRCFRERVIGEAMLRQACDRLGLGIDPTDLRARRARR